jgi:pimeloyl-ACP methyl ester carboxylesterase
VSSLSDFLAWLNELLDGLELGAGVSLVGISYGGALAAQYALHFPGRLGRVVLLAPGNTVLRTRAAFWARLIWAAIRRTDPLATALRARLINTLITDDQTRNQVRAILNTKVVAAQ